MTEFDQFGGKGSRGFSRRSLLKGAGAALATAGAGLTGAFSAQAQKEGLEPGPDYPFFRLPMGSLDTLDKKSYASNMEVIAHLPGAPSAGGEPLMVMWARGKQRLLPAGGGFVDVTEPKNPVMMNKGVIRGGGAVVYNTKLKKWIMMCTAARRSLPQLPNSRMAQYDKELRDRSVNYKGLRGIRNYDITDPMKPNLLQEFNTGEKGNGTHHNFYDGGKYAYLDCGWDDQLRLGKSPAPLQQRHHDRRHDRSGAREGSFPLVGSRPAFGRRRGIQKIRFRQRPLFMDRQSRRDHRSQARRGRRQRSAMAGSARSECSSWI